MNRFGATQGARSSVVNRTHRVLRAQAVQMNSRRDRARIWWLPLALLSSVAVVILFAAFDQMGDRVDGLSETGMEHALPGGVMSVLLMWFLPLSICAGVALLVRNRRNNKRGQ